MSEIPELVKHFAGKYTLQSTDASHPFYATPVSLDDSGAAPVMAAATAGRDETWIAYDTPTGFILQMGDLQYLAQNDEIDTVTATSDVASASRFRWGGPETSGQVTLEIFAFGGWQTVRYAFPRTFPAYLVYPLAPQADTGAGNAMFNRVTVTPSLSSIVEAKSAEGADLRDVDLSGEDLSAVDLKSADFTGATLDGAKFGGSLVDTWLASTSLKGTDFSGAVLDHAHFDGSDISGVIWGPGSRASYASFKGCSAAGAKVGSSSVATWEHAVLDGSDFTDADLTNVDLSSATLIGCTLTGAILATTNLTSAKLGGVAGSPAANLSFAFLTNVNLDKANCFGVSFAYAALFGDTKLTETATLEQADFSNAYLEGISLSNADLRGSKFNNACLVGTDFTGADLSPTNENSTATSLAGACLHGAQFSGAKLAAADFTEATVAFGIGRFNVRYCDPSSGLHPAPPDYLPIIHKVTTGLDKTTLRPDTVCPNGIQFGKQIGTSLQQMLTCSNPATSWVPVTCRTSSTSIDREGRDLANDFAATTPVMP